MKIHGLSGETEALVKELRGVLDAKTERNSLRTAYYNARRLPIDLGVTMPPHLVKRVGAVLGWPSKAVDALAQRIHFRELQVSGDDGVQAVVDEISAANHLDSELPQAFTAGLEHCAAFLLVSKSADDDMPRILPQDALSGTGTWDYRRRELANYLSIARRDDDGQPDVIDLYVDGLRYELHRDGDSDERWTLEGRYSSGVDGVPVEVLPYKPRLGRPFGSSRITRPVMSITDMAVRTVLRAELGAEFYAIPQRWLMGADMSAFGGNGDQATAWKMLVGRIMALDDDDDKENPRAQVGQFPQISMQPHMDQLRSLAQLFAGETSIPVSSLGISIDSNPTSADSYAASREDIIAEAEAAITIWRGAIERTMATALRMVDVPDVKLRAMFRDPRYTSRASAADAFLKYASVMPWLADAPEAIDMMGLDDAHAEALKIAQRRNRGRAILTQAATEA